MDGEQFLNIDLVIDAMKSNCAICKEKLMPYQLWGYLETKRKTKLFYHQNCLGRKEDKNK